jgi:FkbM family methyltransferase
MLRRGGTAVMAVLGVPAMLGSLLVYRGTSDLLLLQHISSNSDAAFAEGYSEAQPQQDPLGGGPTGGGSVVDAGAARSGVGASAPSTPSELGMGAAAFAAAGSGSGSHRAVDRLVSKRSGAGWEVWDRKAVLHPEFGIESPCDWTEYRAVGRPPGLPPVFACVYPEGEDTWVSGLIRKDGRWVNCNTLTEKLMQGDGDNEDGGGRSHKVFMDVGANIGSCVLQILATAADVHVIAFEPSPKNLFRLTSTLMNLPEEAKRRVTLFPVALGSESASSATIVAHPRNAGNTQVVVESSRVEQEAVSGATVATRNIPVERMDDLLSPDLRVDLLKIDVQGFECFVLSGMGRVLDNTRKIFFEVEEELLGRFQGSSSSSSSSSSSGRCSGPLLVQQIQRAGFRVKGVEDLTSRPDQDLRNISFPDQDMYGERRMP